MVFKWADESNAAHDEPLNRCGSDFARELTRKEYAGFDGEIIKVRAERQWEKIDIRANIRIN